MKPTKVEQDLHKAKKGLRRANIQHAGDSFLISLLKTRESEIDALRQLLADAQSEKHQAERRETVAIGLFYTAMALAFLAILAARLVQ